MLGHVSRQSADFASDEYYKRSIDSYDNLNFPAHTYSAHKGLLFSYLALKDDRNPGASWKLS